MSAYSKHLLRPTLLFCESIVVSSRIRRMNG